jgi:hypothetical protein
MQIYQIEIQKEDPKNQMISVIMLQTLLSVIIEGSKGALRLRTEARSMVRGAPPQWLTAATTYSLTFKDNNLLVQSPSLLEAAPEKFDQSSDFPELEAAKTSIDYFLDSLVAAIKNENELLYDKPLLEVFQEFRHVFSQGATQIRFLGKDVDINPETLSLLKEIQVNIPFPSPVKITGRLKDMRAYDRTFKLITSQDGEVIRGIAQPMAQKEVQVLLDKEVLVSGVAYFTKSGKMSRVEAEQISVVVKEETREVAENPLSNK